MNNNHIGTAFEVMKDIADWSSARPMLAEKGMEYIYPESVYEQFPVTEEAEG